MKLLLVLLLSVPALLRAEEIEGSGEEIVDTTYPVPTASVGSFLVVDDPETRRICTCAELQKCNLIKEDVEVRDECAQECSPKLESIDNSTMKLAECFYENYLDELKAGDRCLRSYHQDLCSNSQTDKKIPESNWINKQFDEPVHNPLHKSNVFMTKAELTYNSIRNYQRCFTNCYRTKEHKCREKLNCNAKYPTTDELEQLLAECDEFRQTVFSNARVSCKCMISRKNIVKLVGLCSLFHDNNNLVAHV